MITKKPEIFYFFNNLTTFKSLIISESVLKQ